MRVFTWKRRAVLAALALATGAVLPAAGRTEPSAVSASPAAASAPQNATQALAPSMVSAVQAKLNSYGYSLAVDGVQGPITTRAVLHWQRANGLVVDGIIGPQTLRSLGLDTVPPVQVAVLGPCPQWHPTATSVGWPAERIQWLSGIMYRESRCQPSAYNGRGNDESYGLLQINTKGALWGELMRRCGLTAKSQLHDAATNLSCGYKLYLAYGERPWRVG